jgi:hypothetical protein
MGDTADVTGGKPIAVYMIIITFLIEACINRRKQNTLSFVTLEMVNSDPLIAATRHRQYLKKATSDSTNPKCKFPDKDYVGALMAFIRGSTSSHNSTAVALAQPT